MKENLIRRKGRCYIYLKIIPEISTSLNLLTTASKVVRGQLITDSAPCVKETKKNIPLSLRDLVFVLNPVQHTRVFTASKGAIGFIRLSTASKFFCSRSFFNKEKSN